MRLIPLILASLLGACSRTDAPVDDVSLPPAAIAAFQAHVRTLGRGVLSCSAETIESAHRVTGFVNEDFEPDFAIDTRDLACTTTDDSLSLAYFCGVSMCAYPVLMSDADGWRVIPLMAGNAINVEPGPQGARFVVRQMNYGDPARDTILVREYGWQDDALVRVSEYVEGVEPDAS